MPPTPSALPTPSPAPTVHAARVGRPRVLLALGVLLVGSAWWLRAAPLAPASLWLDDLWVVAPSRASSWGDAAQMLVTAPLFSLAVNAPLVVTGPESVVAQALPFAAGVAAPAIVLWAGWWMGWRWYASTVSAVAAIVAPEHLVFSTRVKQYTMEAAIGFVVVAVAWRVLGRRSSPWTLAALAMVATVLSGSAGAFAGAVLAATVVIAAVDSGHRRLLLGPLAAYGTFALAWWALYLRSHVSEGLRDYWRDDFLTTAGVGSFAADLGASLDRLAQALLPVAPAWPWLAAAALVVAALRPRMALLLAAPLGAAVVLAAFDAAPIGTGRTDIYLLPTAALGLGAAFDAVAERVRDRPVPWLLPAVALTACAGLVLAVVVRDLRPERYPAENVRTLVSEAERNRPEDGRILVYPATRWAYAVYTDGGFEPVDADNETGFDVEITTPGVVVLGPHRDDPQAYVPELEAATADAAVVTFLASHWRSDITVIEEWFLAEGWTQDLRRETDGGLLVRWVRDG